MKVFLLVTSVFLISLPALGQTTSNDSFESLFQSSVDQASDNYSSTLDFRDKNNLTKQSDKISALLKAEIQIQKYEYKGLERFLRDIRGPAYQRLLPKEPNDDFENAIKDFQNAGATIAQFSLERDRLFKAGKLREARDQENRILSKVKQQKEIAGSLEDLLMKNIVENQLALQHQRVASTLTVFPVFPDLGTKTESPLGLTPASSTAEAPNVTTEGKAASTPTSGNNLYDAYLATNPNQ